MLNDNNIELLSELMPFKLTNKETRLTEVYRDQANLFQISNKL